MKTWPRLLLVGISVLKLGPEFAPISAQQIEQELTCLRNPYIEQYTGPEVSFTDPYDIVRETNHIIWDDHDYDRAEQQLLGVIKGEQTKEDPNFSALADFYRSLSTIFHEKSEYSTAAEHLIITLDCETQSGATPRYGDYERIGFEWLEAFEFTGDEEKKIAYLTNSIEYYDRAKEAGIEEGLSNISGSIYNLAKAYGKLYELDPENESAREDSIENHEFALEFQPTYYQAYAQTLRDWGDFEAYNALWERAFSTLEDDQLTLRSYYISQWYDIERFSHIFGFDEQTLVLLEGEINTTLELYYEVDQTEFDGFETDEWNRSVEALTLKRGSVRYMLESEFEYTFEQNNE